MKLKIDENLPQEVAQLLCDHGHEADSVFEETLSGEKDTVLFEVCQNEGRVLMTLDLDFANIQVYPPAAAAGIVVFRLARQDKPSVLAVVEKLIPAFGTNRVSKKLPHQDPRMTLELGMMQRERKRGRAARPRRISVKGLRPLPQSPGGPRRGTCPHPPRRRAGLRLRRGRARPQPHRPGAAWGA